MARALLLNASFEPLCVVSSRRAVVLVLKDKAEIIHRNGAEFTSTHVSRSAQFLSRYLPTIGLASWVPVAAARINSNPGVFSASATQCDGGRPTASCARAGPAVIEEMAISDNSVRRIGQLRSKVR